MANLNKIVKDIEEQIEELNRLKDGAQLEVNKQFLQNEINRLTIVKQNHDKELAKLNDVSKTAQLGVVVKTNYMWDQSDDYIKIYIELDKSDKIDSSEISLQFSSDTKFTCIFGKYRFTLGRLFQSVDQSKSKAIITKSNKLVITLYKLKTGHSWTSLQSKDDAKGPKLDDKSDIDSADPEKSLMNLMKKMYDEGDDEMKRTIAKTWYESQHKQQGAPDFSL